MLKGKYQYKTNENFITQLYGNIYLIKWLMFLTSKAWWSSPHHSIILLKSGSDNMLHVTIISDYVLNIKVGQIPIKFW